MIFPVSQRVATTRRPLPSRRLGAEPCFLACGLDAHNTDAVPQVNRPLRRAPLHMPRALYIHGILVYGFRGYLALPEMVDVWPLPDLDEAIEVAP